MTVLPFVYKPKPKTTTWACPCGGVLSLVQGAVWRCICCGEIVVL